MKRKLAKSGRVLVCPRMSEGIAQAEDQGYGDIELFCLRAGYKTIDIDRADTTGLLDRKRDAARNQFSC
ncbi:hypothetical protein [Bradyrhizobium sp. RDM4]|uniref:hypothetical protein n=1 Tax=Bradyrhizobium sp. RDM4 TaxID=3378765 RepID=UPI0038FCEBEB